MKPHIEELMNSWSHCKKLIDSKANIELTIAFLEEFKVQFTKFYNQIKTSDKNKHKQISLKLVDTVHYLFWKKEGEISRLISFVKYNWNAKQILKKKIVYFDKIILTIITNNNSKKVIS